MKVNLIVSHSVGLSVFHENQTTSVSFPGLSQPLYMSETDKNSHFSFFWKPEAFFELAASCSKECFWTLSYFCSYMIFSSLYIIISMFEMIILIFICSKIHGSFNWIWDVEKIRKGEIEGFWKVRIDEFAQLMN